MTQRPPLVLMILDGFGYCKDSPHNAISNASTPQWSHWWNTRPHLLLNASGNAVGLPTGQMGNSEVGHMHIGAGRIICQDFTRINTALMSGEYDKNPIFIQTIKDTKKQGKALHLMGLLSPGGVHSHEDHLVALIALCAKQGLKTVYLHLFLDGRDTPPKSALQSLKKLQDCLITYPVATIASITGRYYAMDRDHRWQRIEPVYRLLTEGCSDYHFASAEEAIQSFYSQQITDEFIPPTQIGPKRPIDDGDAVLFFNFRADRARQLTEALIARDFHGFSRLCKPTLAHVVSMTSYGENLETECAFPTPILRHTLGEIISDHGLKQLRLAETEKYAHVTFFLNGGSEHVFPGEDRVLIPSPLVKTYDEQPEMSAKKLTETLVDAIQSHRYDVIICNYANADMVGHTGNFSATIQAIECLDQAMCDIWHALEQVGGALLITADHGNAEAMFDDQTHQAHTAHTNEPVPLMYVGNTGHLVSHGMGSLIDIAPTVLALLNITPPEEMTGHILWVNDHDTHL